MTPRADRIAALVAILFVALAATRVVSTYGRFCQTYDEPAHLAPGMEWLDRGTYTVEVQHPPLSRVAVALLPWLAGARYVPPPERVPAGYEPYAAGNDILWRGDHYERTLALARLGNLPFLLLACAIVWLWTRRIAGSIAAAIAVGLFTMVPAVLAHAGLATTDLSLTATLTAALYAFARWLEAPTRSATLLFGAALGLATASKLSALPFFALASVAVLAVRRQRPPVAQTFAAIGCALVVLWAAYRFELGPIVFHGVDPHALALSIAPKSAAMQSLVLRVLSVKQAPAPQFFVGILHLLWHDAHGHRSYLLGQYARYGHWYYFPVVLALKTPLAFVLLALGGTAAALRARSRELLVPLVAAAAILAVAMTSRINIGVRHVLPLYPLAAIVAGAYVARLLREDRARRGVMAAVACGWLAVASALAHPDYLAYLAEPARLAAYPPLVDSDLDWGQDLPRLREAAARRGIQEISIAYFGTTDLNRYFIAPAARPLPAGVRTRGWVAVSRTRLAAVYDAPEAFAWLRAERPVEEIGKSMLLYDVLNAPLADGELHHLRAR